MNLSDLPDDIINHILSYLHDHLTGRDAIRLGLVSKQWLGMLQNRPTLVFDCRTISGQTTRGLGIRRCKNEINYLASTLDRYRRQKIQLKTLTVNFDVTYSCKPKTWLVFENIIRGCPSLETLKVEALTFSDVKVADHLPNLRHLQVRLRWQNLVVSGVLPKLESLFISSGVGLADLGHTTEYPNLRSLEMQCCRIHEHSFTNFARRFPMLEKLCLTCHFTDSLQRINVSSTSLKEIDIDIDLLEACFDVPNVVCFKFSCENLPRLSFEGNSGGWSSCIRLMVLGSHIDSSWFVELNAFVAKLNRPETSIRLELDHENENLFKIEDEEHVYKALANSLTVVQRIREFAIGTYKVRYSSPSARTLLDYIFLIFQPQTITFRETSEKIHMEFYEELISRSRRDQIRVTFEMSQSRARFEDWDEFLEVLKANSPEKYVSFHLEYSS